MRVGSASSSRISSSRVALLGTITRAARRSDVLIARAEERAPGLVVVLRLGEERRVVDGDRHRAAGPQRARVERRVQHLGADLLGEQRQAGLLPGEPGRAVRDRGRAGDDLGAGQHPAVTLRVGALATTARSAVRADPAERAEQAVDVAADTASVGGDTRGVDEHAGRTTGGHVATPRGLLARPLARVRRSNACRAPTTPLDTASLRDLSGARAGRSIDHPAVTRSIVGADD